MAGMGEGVFLMVWMVSAFFFPFAFITLAKH